MGGAKALLDDPEHYSECGAKYDEPCECNDDCPRCGQIFPNGTTEETEEGVCPDCWEQIMDSDD